MTGLRGIARTITGRPSECSLHCSALEAVLPEVSLHRTPPVNGEVQKANCWHSHGGPLLKQFTCELPVLLASAAASSSQATNSVIKSSQGKRLIGRIACATQNTTDTHCVSHITPHDRKRIRMNLQSSTVITRTRFISCWRCISLSGNRMPYVCPKQIALGLWKGQLAPSDAVGTTQNSVIGCHGSWPTRYCLRTCGLVGLNWGWR